METVFRSIIGYIFLLITVRFLGRRPGAQLTPFEFVLIFLVGGVIILSTVGDDRSMTNCFSGVITVGFMHRLISFIKARSPRFGAIVDGTPLVLVKDGQWQSQVMTKMRLQDTDVMAAARMKGIKTLDQIKYAVLERNGSVSVIKRSQK